MSQPSEGEPMRDFDGLVAVVTGGASGIGLATARLLAGRGARVACLDIAAVPDDTLLPVVCDVSSSESVEAAVAHVVGLWGRLDIVINNAGVEARGAIEDHDDTDWATVLDVNVVGMARMVRAALPHLRLSPSAAIVNTCSVAALRGMARLSLYSASKGAVLAMTRALASELLADGVRVCCVAPGTVDTPWVDRLLERSGDPAGTLELLKARQPGGRLVSPDEVATAIAFLASPSMSSVTGIALPVDGGISGLHLASPV